MRSRAARLTLSAAAWLALGAAASFVFTSERSISAREADRGSFETRVRQASSALADARIGQQAYVAPGQSADTWIPKVGALISDASATVDVLRQSAASDAARQALLEASSAITELGNVDKRLREYLSAGDQLMASDVIFGEGVESAALAAARVESAAQSEREVFATYEGRVRELEGTLAGGAAGIAALVLAILAFSGAAAGAAIEHRPVEAPVDMEAQESVRVVAVPSVSARASTAQPAPTPAPAPSVPAAAPTTDEGMTSLKSAAELCTALGRVRDQPELQAALRKAADLLDATGVVVWLGDAAGSDLRPVMVEGYGPQALSMMHPVARTADNAAATAYRTGAFQVVPSRPGGFGAIAAPLVAADGCIGALTAEIRNGVEASSRVEALATILAAQLAGALAQPAPAADAASSADQARASA